MKIKIEITLTDDNHTEEGEEIQVEIEESIPEGFQNLDQWEQDVHKIGLKSMRELFKSGIELYEEKVISEYGHKTRRGRQKQCHVVRRGFRDFTIRTVFGKVTFPRQRTFCKICNEWVIPLNEALGLHDDEQERATIGFKELCCLYAVHHPYRSAAEKAEQMTQDPQVVSHEQIRQIVQEEGRRVREREEEERKDAMFCFVKALQNGHYYRPTHNGRFYVFLDGILVRSNSGKGRYHEGKVGFICDDKRESAGRRLKIPRKRYVSSFESSYVLGGRVRGEALRMALRVYKHVFVIGDGARWIRKIWYLCFPEAVYILDWYHLHDKLYKALCLTLPHSASLRKPIHRQISGHLWRGLKEQALKELKALHSQLLSKGMQKRLAQDGGLEELIAYIESNWIGIVNYRKMYEAGYLIASSLVEKAADLVVAKRQKKKQGMHWTRMGSDRLSALRTLWLNGDWEEYWRERREKAA
jgi:hypothetical protein